jgi:hypothetical protein
VEGAVMGYTSKGKDLNLHMGEIVSTRDIISNERGRPIPPEKRCDVCWFFGNQIVTPIRRNGKQKQDFYLFCVCEGVVVYFNNSDVKIPVDAESRKVCLAGFRGDIEEIKGLLTLEKPEIHSCYQQRTCKPQKRPRI